VKNLVELVRNKGGALKWWAIVVNSMCFLSVNFSYFILDGQELELSVFFALFYLYLFSPYLLAILISIRCDVRCMSSLAFCTVTTLISIGGAYWSYLMLAHASAERTYGVIFLPIVIAIVIFIVKLLIVLIARFTARS